MKIFDINSLTDYLNHVDAVQNSLETFVYRGQSDASWQLASGVFRRISESKQRAKINKTEVTVEEVLEYLTEKLTEAKKRLTPYQISEIHELNDINLLVEMQHYGGATNLIDFTFNSLIALYFACIDHQGVDGKVFCINNSNPYKILSTQKTILKELFPTSPGKFYTYAPNHSNRRIIKQDSIFIFNDIGSIDDSLIDFVFIIQATAKEKIVQQLKDLVGITDESIYPDFLGYLQANNARKPFKIKNAQDYFEQATKFHKNREFYQAIDYYNKSLFIDPNQSKANLGISQALRALEKYEDAVESCKKAKALDDKNFMISNELALLHTYMHNYIEAKAHFAAAEVLAQNENEQRIYRNNLGWMYVCFRETAKAKEILEELIPESNPYHQAINLGHCYLLEKNLDEAFKYYRLCLKNAANQEDFTRSFLSDYNALDLNKDGISIDQYSSILKEIFKRHEISVLKSKSESIVDNDEFRK